jgi:hypothetical protein
MKSIISGTTTAGETAASFENGRQSGHNDRCLAYPTESVSPQLEPCPQKDHNQSNFAKVSRDLHHLWPHQAYDIWPHQNPDDKHANQARELELAEQDIRCQAKDHDQRQAYCHNHPPKNHKKRKTNSVSENSLQLSNRAVQCFKFPFDNLELSITFSTAPIRAKIIPSPPESPCD